MPAAVPVAGVVPARPTVVRVAPIASPRCTPREETRGDVTGDAVSRHAAARRREERSDRHPELQRPFVWTASKSAILWALVESQPVRRTDSHPCGDQHHRQGRPRQRASRAPGDRPSHQPRSGTIGHLRAAGAHEGVEAGADHPTGQGRVQFATTSSSRGYKTVRVLEKDGDCWPSHTLSAFRRRVV